MIQQSVRRNHEQWLSLNTNVFFSVLRDSVEEILVHLSEYLAIYSKVFRIYLRKVLVNMHLSVSLHFSRTSACALVSVKSSEKEFHSNKRIDGLNISFPESVKSDWFTHFSPLYCCYSLIIFTVRPLDLSFFSPSIVRVRTGSSWKDHARNSHA